MQKILKSIVFFCGCIRTGKEGVLNSKKRGKQAQHNQLKLQKYALERPKRLYKIISGDCKFEGPYLYLLSIVMQNKTWAAAHLFTKLVDILINLLIVRHGFDIYHNLKSRYGHQISLMLHQLWQLFCTYVECTFQLQFLDTVFEESITNCFSKTNQYLMRAKNEDFMRLTQAPYQAWDLYVQTMDKYLIVMTLPILIATALQNSAHGMPKLKADWIEKNIKEDQYTEKYKAAHKEFKDGDGDEELKRKEANKVVDDFEKLLKDQGAIGTEVVQNYMKEKERLKTMTVDAEGDRQIFQKAQMQLWNDIYAQSPVYMAAVCGYLAMANLSIPIACIAISALMQFAASAYLMDYLQHDRATEHYLIDTTENLHKIYVDNTKEPEQCRMLEMERALLNNHVKRQMIKSITQMDLFNVACGLLACTEKLKELRKGEIDTARRSIVAHRLNALAFFDYQVRKMIQQHHTNTGAIYAELEACLEIIRKGNQPRAKECPNQFISRYPFGPLEIRIDGEGFAYETGRAEDQNETKITIEEAQICQLSRETL